MKWIGLVALVFVCGCKHDPDLVGTWTSGLGGAVTQYHFRKDGTFMLDNLYAATHAVVEGKYSVENGQLVLTPEKSNVEGDPTKAAEIRSVIMQPSRVTMIRHSPMEFQLGLQTPPLLLHRVSSTP